MQERTGDFILFLDNDLDDGVAVTDLCRCLGSRPFLILNSFESLKFI
jgi:hypothetical protein